MLRRRLPFRHLRGSAIGVLAALHLIALGAVAGDQNPNTGWLNGARLGAFMHFLPGDAAGLAKVKDFDVPHLAQQLEAAGARYFVLTLGQNSGYFNSPNAAYDRVTGYTAGERCSTRDLPLDLYRALHPKGIRLMLYLPCQVPNQDKRAQKAFGLREGPQDQPLDAAFARQWAEVIHEWSARYGEKVAGWWFDGGYQHIHFNEEIAGIYADAVKRGNPKAIVTFNPGVSLIRWTQAEDYTAGELNDPFGTLPESRWVKGSQWHALTYLGGNWSQRDVRHPTDKWVAWVQAVVARGGVVTLDMGPNWDPQAGPIGSLDRMQLAQVKAIRLTLAQAAPGDGSVSGAEFFVAPDGNDANPGTAAQPFATFLRSRQAVRAQRAAGALEAVTVTFKAGRYELGAPLEFDARDSGASAEQPVTYRAEQGAEVEISGGRRITGWQKDPQRPGVWKTRVRESNWDDQSWRYEQLWVNGQRAIRARTPNYWQFSLLLGVTEAPGAESGRMTHTFAAKSKDLATLRGLSPEALRDAQVMVFHKWDTTREWLDTVSLEEGVFTTRGAKMQGWNAMTRDCLYYFENYLAALDAPGEWFLDRDGWLYYLPRPGEDMATAVVVAPTIPAFLTIRGTVDQPDRWVKHLRFEGLKFRHAEFRTPRAGIPPAQAAMNLDATAVMLDGAQDIRFADCAVEHTGSTAFWFRKACRDCRVERTRMYDLGIEGVRIGEPQIVPEAVRTGGITIDNCIIQSGGRIAPHTVAVWIGHSSDNAITHCDVGDFFYTAISVGWRWGYEESAAKRNRIEFNHLHHLGYRILSDMGGVYTLGPSEGTRVCNNVIHDVYSTRYGGWGLYPDEGSTGILLENNLVYDVRDGCVHQHYGKENIFRNNILAFSEEGQVAVTRAEPHLSFTFEHNLVYWDTGYLLGYSGWKGGAKVTLRNNLYWREGGQPFDFAGKTWEQWRAAGNDEGSLIADPLFVDVAKRDFRLRPGSPADKIGFKPFDFTQAGVYGDPAWKRLASSVTFPKPYMVPGPEPLSLRDDFEGKSPNSLLAVAALETENHPELIALTTDVAASGTHSLRIKDRAGLKQAYNPHFYWDPNYTKGRARMAFRIRLEPGANVHCEWRSQGHPYTAGPSLHFHDQAVTARGQKLADLPENQWIGVEIRAPLGQSGSKYEVTLTLPDGTKREAKGLPSDPAWKEARWVGFSSNANAETAYELDDLEMVNHRPDGR